MSQRTHTLFREYETWKTVFWISIALNALAYLGHIVHFTYAVDDYGYMFSSVNHLAHGRWLAGFIYNVLLQKSFIPTLAPIIGIICYVLTGIGLCKLWSIPKKSSFLVIALWSLHPYLLDAYNFRIATVNCAFTYLVAVTALLLIPKGKRAFAIAVILFYLALSIYQVALGFAIAAVMVQVLLVSFRERFSAASVRNCAKLFLRYLLMLGLSVAVYLVLTKLIFRMFDIEVNSRLQAGFISDIDQLKSKLCVIATTLFVRLGPVKEFVLPFAGKLALFIIYVLAILTVIRKSPRWHATLGALLWITLIPLGAISFVLPLVTHDMPWRICMGLVVFIAGMLALTQESNSPAIRRTTMAVAVFLIGYFILNNNTILYKQHLTNQNDRVMGNRIIAKMQSLDGYQPGMELAIVGRIQKETFSKEGKSNLEIITEYAKHSSARRYSLAKSAFETDWSKYSFLLKYMDLELKRCGPANFKKAIAFSQGRKPWPDPSSVFIQDDIVTLILSIPDVSPNAGRNLNKSNESSF